MVRFEVYFEDSINRIIGGLDLRCEREKRSQGGFESVGPYQIREDSLELLAEKEEKLDLGHAEFPMSVKPVEMMGMLWNIPVWFAE